MHKNLIIMDLKKLILYIMLIYVFQNKNRVNILHIMNLN
jgi:hypothetical protein